MIKIVLDTYSGDLEMIESMTAAIKFVKDFNDVELFLVGNFSTLTKPHDRVTLINADEKMPMDIGAMDALRKRSTSMYVATDVMNNEKADALVSAGSTGALLTLATVKFKKIEEVLRPALISPIPTNDPNKKVIFMDLGASNENSAEELVQFAKMARIYAQKAFNNVNPTVALLSNGSEEAKGSPVSKEAYKIMKEIDFPNFIGNIEAKDVVFNKADIVITDGYSGNIFLKACEGTSLLVKDAMKKMFKKNILTKVAYLLLGKNISIMSDTMSSKKTGGAMMIGLNKIVIKAHGSSEKIAFYNALKVAYNCSKEKVVELIKTGLSDEK